MLDHASRDTLRDLRGDSGNQGRTQGPPRELRRTPSIGSQTHGPAGGSLPLRDQGSQGGQASSFLDKLIRDARGDLQGSGGAFHAQGQDRMGRIDVGGVVGRQEPGTAPGRDSKNTDAANKVKPLPLWAWYALAFVVTFALVRANV